MNRELGLRILAQIMEWGDEEARKEFRWLSFMSRYKYDDYRGYLAGARFIESLATWLQQFESKDRKAAYEYIKENLIYIGPAEMQRLVEQFFPEIVQKNLKAKVAKNLGVPEYMVQSSKENLENFNSEVRRTLFMGLSDGARLDSLRRANSGIISNEQVAITTEINNAKWKDLLDELEKDSRNKSEGEEKRKFERVYLIDDFTASGTSFIRKDDGGELREKLAKFSSALGQARKDLKESLFVDGFQILVHHYIGTNQAQEKIIKLYNQFKYKEGLKVMSQSNVNFSFGMLFPKDIRLTRLPKEGFADLCERYYDPSIYDRHFKKSGVTLPHFYYHIQS